MTDNKFWCGCWGKRNPHSPLVGLQTATATPEISEESPQKKKKKKKLTKILSSNPAVPFLPIYPMI